MRNVFLGMVLATLLVGAYLFGNRNADKTTVTDSGVLQQTLKNVSKLVVTEGHYSDIITYKDAKAIYLSWIKAEKKAVVLVNAKATVAYDLNQLEFAVNEATNTLTITNIPEAELQIYPKLQYYDIQADFLNEFTPNDYNKISTLVDQKLRKKIAQSTLLSNAKNRLLSELYTLLNKEGIYYKIELKSSQNSNYNKVLFLDNSQK